MEQPSTENEYILYETPKTITLSEIVNEEQPKVLTELVPLVVPILKRKINAYHEMFSLPLIAEFWEETLHRAFDELGYKTTWGPNRSHTVGEDMRIVNIPNSRISCKSGQFIKSRAIKKECIKFNGGRSTSFPTLQEKIDHFSADHDDYYFCLAKNKQFNNTYKLLVFPSSLCKVNQLEWTETPSGFKGDGPFMANIAIAMSAQLWTTLPLDLIAFSYDIDCRN